jgi:predicted MFS family arabinose efflux permease
MKLLDRWNSADINLRFFLIGIFFFGINNGILLTTFNNYLNDIFRLSATERGFLEFPRELPGFMLVAVTGILSSYSIRTWAVMVGLISAAGVLGLGFLSPNLYLMTFWMMTWSLSDHLFMPVESVMGLHLATDGRQGKRLGQISGSRNLAMIFGAGTVWIYGQFFSGVIYPGLFAFAAVASLGAAFAFSKVKVEKDSANGKKRFVLKKEYKLFYILNILFGARKQIFLTFAPWVFVTTFGTKPETMAILILISSIAGVIFRQAFGTLTDIVGERRMFMADSIILLGVCAGFALSKNLYLLYFLFIVDNLMFATRIARTTYLNRIVLSKSDIPATISTGITMDHVVSMTIPAFGGMLWISYGYESVFFAASIIAVLGFITALKVDKKVKVKI